MVQNTPKRTSGKKCYKCHNNIAIDSSTYSAEDKVAHLHCLSPKARKR